MSYKSKLKKAERDTVQCVEKLKKSIRDQYGISLQDWLRIKKEEINDYKHRENRT